MCNSQPITRGMIEAIHRAFDRRTPSGLEILANHTRSRVAREAARRAELKLPAGKPDPLDTRNRKSVRKRRSPAKARR